MAPMVVVIAAGAMRKCPMTTVKCEKVVALHLFEASAQAMKASSSAVSRNAKPAVLQNLLTDSGAKPAADTTHDDVDSAAKPGETSVDDAHSAAKSVETVTLRVVSALSSEHMFGPLRIPRTEKVSSVVRKLQHLSLSDNPDGIGKQIQLVWNDRILDPLMPVPHLDLEPSQELVLSMIAEPVLLSWDQLVAMPAMRKRAGRGGKGACVKQRRLRVFCFDNNIRQLDLSESDYDWRLLLKTMPSLRTNTVIGPGVVRFMFRLLDAIDGNYAGRYGKHVEDMGQRHVFEMSCANGDQWHLHFHQGGSCDLEHLRCNVT